ncbi:MAG: hypothetical protein GY816_12605 [Cytophagales bacterium]|nr:hypothetical protein [Cytophagales bacterium]
MKKKISTFVLITCLCVGTSDAQDDLITQIDCETWGDEDWSLTHNYIKKNKPGLRWTGASTRMDDPNITSITPRIKSDFNYQYTFLATRWTIVDTKIPYNLMINDINDQNLLTESISSCGMIINPLELFDYFKQDLLIFYIKRDQNKYYQHGIEFVLIKDQFLKGEGLKTAACTDLDCLRRNFFDTRLFLEGISNMEANSVHFSSMESQDFYWTLMNFSSIYGNNEIGIPPKVLLHDLKTAKITKHSCGR